ncbi:MAG: class I SAM-dependent methyltransferase [Bacteroidia bacterium]
MGPYSLFQILRKLLVYWLTAKTRHSVHSPFVFAFISDVLPNKQNSSFIDIEQLRRRLKRSKELIEFEDHGKGGVVVQKKVGSIAKLSLKPRKYAELLAKTCNYFKVENALELGTSLGLTSAYIARSIKGRLQTYEGSKSVVQLAEQNWAELGINNIDISCGPFENTVFSSDFHKPLDFVFIDGNHQKQPTLAYYKHLIKSCHERTVLVFDDIHWSKDMEDAWELIKAEEAVTTTLDLFFIGIVFLRKELSKEHFTIRY